MITLSVRQPWSYLLCKGIKPIENRSWKLPEKYKGKRVLIHASSQPWPWYKTLYYIRSLANSKEILDILQDIKFNGESLRNLPTSAIVGSVVFTDCVINHPSIWAEKTKINCSHPLKCGSWSTDSCTEGCVHHCGFIKPIYNWVCEDPILFDKPVLNVKGKLNFWDYNPETLPPQLIDYVLDEKGIV